MLISNTTNTGKKKKNNSLVNSIAGLADQMPDLIKDAVDKTVNQPKKDLTSVKQEAKKLAQQNAAAKKQTAKNLANTASKITSDPIGGAISATIDLINSNQVKNAIQKVSQFNKDFSDTYYSNNRNVEKMENDARSSYINQIDQLQQEMSNQTLQSRKNAYQERIDSIKQQQQAFEDQITKMKNALINNEIDMSAFSDLMEEQYRAATNDNFGSAMTGIGLGLADLIATPGNLINSGIDIGGEILGDASDWIGDMTGIDWFNEVGEDLKGYDPNAENNIMKAINDAIDREAYLNSLGTSQGSQVVSDILRSYTVAAGDMALAAVTGGGSAVVTGLGSLRSFEQAYTENLEEGYDFGQSVSNAAVHGTITAIAEAVPDAMMMELFSKPIGRELTGYLSNIAKQTVAEGLSEGIEYDLGWRADRLMLGSTEEYNVGQLLYSMGVGALGGMFMSGVAGIPATIAQNYKTQKSINQLQADRDLIIDLANSGKIEMDQDYRNAIRLADDAINGFNNKSVIGDAVQFQADEPYRTSVQEIDRTLNEASEIERQRAAQATNRIAQSAQIILDQKGINMDASQYSMLDADTRNNIDLVQNYANELGANVRFDTSMPDAGYYDTTTGSIYINPDSDLAPITLFTHELTHSVENNAYYDQIRNIVTEDAGQRLSGDLDYIKRRYQELGHTLNDDQAMREYVAIQMQERLGNEDFVKRLVRYNDSLAYRLYSDIRNIVNKTDKSKSIEYNFLKAFRDADPNVLSNRTNDSSVPQTDNEVGVQYNLNTQLADGVSNTGDNGTTYTDQNGTTIFNVDNSYSELESYIEANGGNKAKAIKRYLLDNYRGKLINIGDVYDANFNRRSAEEFSYPANRRRSQDAIDTKDIISVNLDDISLKAQFLDTKKNTKPNKKADYYDYFKVSFGIDDGNGVSYYDGILNVEVVNDVPMFYDITQIKRSSRTSVLTESGASSTNNISNNNQNVNRSVGLSQEELNILDHKQQQLDMILRDNPANNEYSTWIRNIDDIKTYQETLQDPEWSEYVQDGFDPDYTGDMVQDALDSGTIRVYSSYPIESGTWVTPSRMEAESYSGSGEIYSQDVNLEDIAWVDPTQGMMARVDNNQYSTGISGEDLDINELASKTGSDPQSVQKVVDLADEGVQADVQENADILEVSDEEFKRLITGEGTNWVNENSPELDQMIKDNKEVAEAYNIYNTNPAYTKSTASVVNNIMKGFQGYSKGQYDQTYNDQVAVNMAKEMIGGMRERSQESFSSTISDLLDRGRNKHNYQKTFEQNLDVIANGDTDLRQKLRDVLEAPRDEAYAKMADIKLEANDIAKQMIDMGIRKGTKEAKAVTFIGEGHTDQTISQNIDGKEIKTWVPYSETQLRQEFNYTAPNGKPMYENIKEAASTLRKFYDTRINNINDYRINNVYGDIEGETKLQLSKTLGEIKLAQEQLLEIQKQLTNNPSPALVAGFEAQQEKISSLRKRFNKLNRESKSGDNVRREMLLYRSDYFPHVRKKQSILDILKGKNNNVPTELVGISDFTNPRTSFSSIFMQQGMGDYDADAFSGLEYYANISSETEAFDPYIDHLRNFVKELRSESVGTEMNDVTEYLNDYANMLANKTNDIDRVFVGKIFGRKTIRGLKELNSRVRRNTLLGNFRTMISQTLNIPNGLGVIVQNGGNLSDVAKGLTNYAKSLFNQDLDQRRSSAFLTNRFFDMDTGERGIRSKLNDMASFMLTQGDKISTDIIWEISKATGDRLGVSNSMTFADDLARRSVAGRSKGEIPITLNSQLINLIAPFQLEVNNAYQTLKGSLTGKNKFRTVATIVLSSYVMNTFTEMLFGDRTLWDPIDAVLSGIIDDDEDDKERTIDERISESLGNLAGTTLSAIPFINQGLSLFGIDSDTGETIFGEDYNPNRYGTGNIGLNRISDIFQDAMDGDWSNALSDFIFYYGMPAGGGQAQRSLEALQSYGIVPQIGRNGLENEPRYYTGSGNIGFVQDNPFTMENPTLGDYMNFLQDTVFGRWAGDEGRGYIDSDFKSGLTESGTDMFYDLHDDMGLDDRQAFDLVKSIKNIESVKDSSGETIKNSRAALIRQEIDDTIGWDRFKSFVTSDEASKYNLNKTVYEMDDSEYNDLLSSLGINVSAAEGSNEGGYLDAQAQAQSALQSQIDELTDYQFDTFDLLNDFTDDENALSVTQDLYEAQGVKGSNGKTIRNSKSLALRAVLVEQGLWDDYISNVSVDESSDATGIGKTVYNMTDEEFVKAYEEMFGESIAMSSEPSNVQSAPSSSSSLVSNYTGSSSIRNTSNKTSSSTINNPTVSVDLSKPIDFTTDDYETAKRKVDYYMAEMELERKQKNDLTDILEDFVYNSEIQKTVEDVIDRYMKSSLYDLIKQYLEDHPYADASVFGL